MKALLKAQATSPIKAFKGLLPVSQLRCHKMMSKQVLGCRARVGGLLEPGNITALLHISHARLRKLARARTGTLLKKTHMRTDFYTQHLLDSA